MSNANPIKEPSMNEILASIRQIIEGGGERPGTGPASQRRQGPATSSLRPSREPLPAPAGEAQARSSIAPDEGEAASLETAETPNASLPAAARIPSDVNEGGHADIDRTPPRRMEADDVIAKATERSMMSEPRVAAQRDVLHADTAASPQPDVLPAQIDETSASVARLRALSVAARKPDVLADPLDGEEEPEAADASKLPETDWRDDAGNDDALSGGRVATDDEDADAPESVPANGLRGGIDILTAETRPPLGNVVSLRDFSFDFDEEGFAAELMSETGLDAADEDASLAVGETSAVRERRDAAEAGSASQLPFDRHTDPVAESRTAVADHLHRSAAQPTSALEEPVAHAVSGIGGFGSLISREAGAQVAASFDALATAIRENQMKSMEQMTRDMLRPMLQEWLDDNLPRLVEKMVREEIERVARGGRR